LPDARNVFDERQIKAIQGLLVLFTVAAKAGWNVAKTNNAELSRIDDRQARRTFEESLSKLRKPAAMGD
jgi:hypothetical protein